MSMSTQGLKIATTALLIGCALLLVGWPVILGPRPPTNAHGEMKLYATRFVETIGLIVTLLVLAGVGAILILRRTAAEFRLAHRDNMRSLIDGTAQDALKEKDDARD